VSSKKRGPGGGRKATVRPRTDEPDVDETESADATGKRPRGRPSKLTDKVVKAIVKTLRDGNYRVTAARAAGVSYESFALWFGKGKTARTGPFKDFYDAVLAAETYAETSLVQIIRREARLDAKHAKWFLAHRFRERWADNLSQGKLEVSGPNGKPMQIEGARERLLARLEQLAARRAPPKTDAG
jgi:hypothetical protein